MWSFRRKKTSHPRSGPTCSYCGGIDTIVTSYHSSDQPNYIRTWRGQRYLTCRCSDCGRDFYAKEPLQGPKEEFLTDEKIVNDEDELYTAEEEVKRQADDEGDHRYKLNGM